VRDCCLNTSCTCGSIHEGDDRAAYKFCSWPIVMFENERGEVGIVPGIKGFITHFNTA